MDRILELDKQLFLALNFDGGPFWDEFFWLVSGKLTWIPLYVLIVFLLYRRYGIKFTILAVVIIALTVGAADQVSNFFKNNIPKPRPTHNPDFEGLIALVKGYRGFKYGTVSAHAATTFGIMTISTSLIRRKWFIITTVMWALLVSYSRIYIGAHYPLDILFGALAGVIIGVLAVRLIRAIDLWYRKKQETSKQDN